MASSESNTDSPRKYTLRKRTTKTLFYWEAEDDDSPKKRVKKRKAEIKHYSSDEDDADPGYKPAVRSSDDEPDTQTKAPTTPRRKNASTKTTRRFTQKKSSRCKLPIPLPQRVLPRKKPQSVLEDARERLQVSAQPETLPCREEEFADIYQFVYAKISDESSGCLYIYGVPGTGKTATVHQVVHLLEQQRTLRELGDFRVIEVNGMRLTDPHQAYVQILMELTGEKATADHSAVLLEKYFSKRDTLKEPVLLVVDELDLLWTKNQDVIYSIFDWPTRPQAKLTVLAIANTMDLPERIMMKKVTSRLGMTRMSFQTYTYKDLQEIVMSRIKGLKAFEEDAVQLVARKVAALSGDARRALDACRRATELAEVDGTRVGVKHVDAALQEMFSNPKIQFIRNASLHQKLFLKSLIAEFHRSGIEEAVYGKVFKQHMELCRLEGITPPNCSAIQSVCHKLASCRLLLAEHGRLDLQQRIKLNVSIDDVNFALKDWKITD